MYLKIINMIEPNSKLNPCFSLYECERVTYSQNIKEKTEEYGEEWIIFLESKNDKNYPAYLPREIIVHTKGNEVYVMNDNGQTIERIM
jgi:hypothetical protein